MGPAGIADDAVKAPEWCEPDVGVVGAGGHAEFGAGGEHAVGLRDAFGDEVVDHDTDVGVAAGDDHLGLFEC